MVLVFSPPLFLSTGSSASQSVQQTPSALIKNLGDSVDKEILCSHSVQSYDRILWYKQHLDGALQLLGYLYIDSPYPEEDVKGQISFEGDGRSESKLSISTLSPSDGAVYFCAASLHSDAPSFSPLQKPSCDKSGDQCV